MTNQTLWYLYFCPKLNLSTFLLNPLSTKVLTASTPCPKAASICPHNEMRGKKTERKIPRNKKRIYIIQIWIHDSQQIKDLKHSCRCVTVAENC